MYSKLLELYCYSNHFCSYTVWKWELERLFETNLLVAQKKFYGLPCGRIRDHDLFSAMAKNAGEKRKIIVFYV